MEMTCPKCGAGRLLVKPVYHQSEADCIDPRFKFTGEHLHCACTECFFEWSEKPADAGQAQPSSE
jgi:hypothetical protein